jgi:integrase
VEALRTTLELGGKLSVQTASHLKRVETDFGTPRAAHLTPEQIEKYIQCRLAAGDRPATINRTTQLLKQAYKLSLARGHLSRIPSIKRLCEKGNERKGFLTPADFQKVLAALPNDLKEFCQWGYATGMRKDETALLRWDMIEGDELRIPGDIRKNREARTLPLCGELAAIIERRRALCMVKENGTARMVEFVFHRDGVPVAGFRRSWKTACAKAGVAGTRIMISAGVRREISRRPECLGS